MCAFEASGNEFRTWLCSQGVASILVAGLQACLGSYSVWEKGVTIQSTSVWGECIEGHSMLGECTRTQLETVEMRNAAKPMLGIRLEPMPWWQGAVQVLEARQPQ